jgi:hypothetical protein
MTRSIVVQLCSMLFVVFCVPGCKKIEPVMADSATVTVHRKSDGVTVHPPKTTLLSNEQIQLVEDWLNTNKTGWTSHTPMATLLPYWCMELKRRSETSVGFCNYGQRVVLRGLGEEIEHPFSEHDKTLFIQNIGALN